MQYIPAWTVSGGFFGNVRMMKVTEKILRERLSKYSSRIFVINARFFHKYYHLLIYVPFYSTIKKVDMLSSVVNVFLGIPSIIALPLVYNKGWNFPKKSYGCRSRFGLRFNLISGMHNYERGF